jgi:hypothetical protein
MIVSKEAQKAKEYFDFDLEGHGFNKEIIKYYQVTSDSLLFYVDMPNYQLSDSLTKKWLYEGNAYRIVAGFKNLKEDTSEGVEIMFIETFLSAEQKWVKCSKPLNEAAVYAALSDVLLEEPNTYPEQESEFVDLLDYLLDHLDISH